MDTKEKMVELLRDAPYNIFDNKLGGMLFDSCLALIADHLISNGVTVQECILPEGEYYVLRNTETGMYFRGKGANRWGKHFNQAAIYRVKGTAERSIKDVAWHGEKAELVRIKIVEMPQPSKGE